MIQTNHAKPLGIILALLVSASAGAQQIRRPSSLPPMRFGTLPQPEPPRPLIGDGRIHGGRVFGHGLGRLTKLGLLRAGFFDAPYYSQPVIPYQVPVYVPVPVPVWTREYVGPAAPPAKPYDPKKSRMLTIGGGADGGGGVMRVERLADSVLRVTWLGNVRPVREARLFLADSAQRPLRSALVDSVTTSAVFRISGLESQIAYTGLTVFFANGAIETTLVPYPGKPGERP